MKGYLWAYRAKIASTANNNTLHIRFEPPKQGMLEFLFLRAEQSTATTQEFSIRQYLRGTAYAYYLEDCAIDLLYYPNVDLIETFGLLRTEKILIAENDFFQIVLQNDVDNTEYFDLQIRFIVSIYAIPTIGTGANTSVTEYTNEIVGVIE